MNSLLMAIVSMFWIVVIAGGILAPGIVIPISIEIGTIATVTAAAVTVFRGAWDLWAS
jgi:hypothetical protein